MSLSEGLEALPTVTLEERQLLRRVIDLDDQPLPEADEALVHSRLTAHHLDPTSSISLDQLKERLRTRTKV